ncbi:MAG: hypothetical protein HY537_18020 [Deltaproteobacteria bacterium]|nr:hypothetical protein [Deltaproteobacteria bacterium]
MSYDSPLFLLHIGFAATLFAVPSPLGKPGLEIALQEIQKGHYAEALTLIEELPKSEKYNLTALYWAGVSRMNLQDFKPASKKFRLVLAKDVCNEFPEAPYYLGQALYAQRNYSKAIDAFRIAKYRGTQIAPSLYYEGYLQLLLNDKIEALNLFNQLIDYESAAPEWKQAAQFQIGEMLFVDTSKSKGKTKRKLALRQTIPAYHRAIAMAPDGELAAQAQSRISDVYKLIGQSGPETVGKVPIATKPWLLSLNQEFKFDTNIINQPDEVMTEPYTGSALMRTSVFGRYEKVFRNRIAVAPELSMDITLHQRRDNPSVYGNDSININPALRARIDHLINAQSASMLFEYEFSKGTRDYLQNHSQPHYGVSHNFILGERANIFKFGTSTLLLNLRHFDSAVFSGLTQLVPGITLSQVFALSDSQSLSASFNFETQVSNLPVFNQRAYRLTLGTGFSMPWDLSLDFAFIATLTDTMEQQSIRGTETNLLPMATLTKFIDSQGHFSVTLTYLYMRNLSKDTQDYQFSKHIAGLGLGLTL